MTGTASPQAVFSAISDLEDDVHKVMHFSLVIQAMGYSPHMIDPNAVHVIGEALEALAKHLRTQWDFAYSEARGATR